MPILVPKQWIATIAHASDAAASDQAGQAFVVVVTVAILVAFALRLTSRAIAPIGVIVRAVVAVGIAALVMLAALALVVVYAVNYL